MGDVVSTVRPGSVVYAVNRVKVLFIDPVVQLFSLHISTLRPYSTI